MPTSLVRPPIKQAHNPTYAAIPTLLTAAEQDFFHVLRDATPVGYIVFPQVRLAGLVRTTAKQKQAKKYDFYRIQAKTVDFVLCEVMTTTPRLVIELDDSSHNQAHRKQRDAFVDGVLADVGLPIIHILWRPRYDGQKLAQLIQEQLGLMVPPAAIPPPSTLNWDTPIRIGPAPAVIRSHMPISDSYEPPRLVNVRVESTQSSVESAPRGSQIVCGSCRAPVGMQSKYCSACGAVLA